jgi:uncharacterized protein with HEPN domain
MYDKDLVKKIFINVHESIAIIVRRCSKIQSANDFVVNDDGIETLDSISMRLQFIGESLKKVEKINKSFFETYNAIEWEKIINLRDFISHHYDMLNHEIIFDICINHVPQLGEQVKKIIDDLTEN